MKKTLRLLMFVLMAVTLASCEDDEVAESLDGIWEGEVATSYFSHRGLAHTYHSVDMHFFNDPYKYARGRGVEYDYTRVDCRKTGFDYQVMGGVIYIDYDDGTNVTIRHYKLDGLLFFGEFRDRDGRFLANFSFMKVNKYREVAKSLSGIWEGGVTTDYFSHRRKPSSFQYVDLEFQTDPYFFAKGTGVERDYYKDARGDWYYETVEFRFEVIAGIIYMDYADDTRVMIRNYSLNNGFFEGEFCTPNGKYLSSFQFEKVANWWNDRHFGRSGEGTPKETAHYRLESKE